MAVKLFGHTVSTPAAVAIAGGSGLAIWFAYKQHEASAAAAAPAPATSPTAIDPVTGLPYSQDDQVDPLTGMTYLAEAQEYGSVSAAEQAAAGESGDDLTSEYDSGLDDSALAGTSTDTSLEAVPGGYATNAQWAQAVTAGLSDLGYSSTDVAAALGMYLGSLPLSTLADGVSSSSIVSAALAEYGPPPVGTFTMIAASPVTTTGTGTGSPGGGGSGTGGTGSATIKVPDVVGKTVNQAQTALSAAGLSYNTDTSKDKAGYSRIVTAENPKAGTKAAPDTHVGLTWHYVKN